MTIHEAVVALSILDNRFEHGLVTQQEYEKQAVECANQILTVVRKEPNDSSSRKPAAVKASSRS